jgi:hypothetical protein
MLGEDLKELVSKRIEWVCEENPDQLHNSCAVPQEMTDAAIDRCVCSLSSLGLMAIGDVPAAPIIHLSSGQQHLSFMSRGTVAMQHRIALLGVKVSGEKTFLCLPHPTIPSHCVFDNALPFLGHVGALIDSKSPQLPDTEPNHVGMVQENAARVLQAIIGPSIRLP